MPIRIMPKPRLDVSYPIFYNGGGKMGSFLGSFGKIPYFLLILATFVCYLLDMRYISVKFKQRRSPAGSIRAAALLFIACVVQSLFGGCATVGPDYIKPDTQAPPVWHTPLKNGLTSERGGLTTMASWWDHTQRSGPFPSR